MTKTIGATMERDVDTCTKSPTGEHVWNYTPRPDNCRLGTCRYCEQQRVFEGGMTHTAALIKTAPVKPETLEKAVQIAEKSLERETPLQLKTGAIAESYHAEILRRLAAGDKPGAIAKDIGYEVSSVYTFKYKHARELKRAAKLKAGDEVAPRAKVVPYAKTAHQVVRVSLEDEPAAPEVKRNGHKPEFNYSSRKGNIMSQMNRLGRGEIRTHAAGPVITRYKEMLEETLRVKQSEVKELKAKISVADEALRELNIIQQGEKSAVEKVLAVVR